MHALRKGWIGARPSIAVSRPAKSETRECVQTYRERARKPEFEDNKWWYTKGWVSGLISNVVRSAPVFSRYRNLLEPWDVPALTESVRARLFQIPGTRPL